MFNLSKLKAMVSYKVDLLFWQPVSKCSEKGGILCNYYEAYVMLSTDVGERLVEKHYAQPVPSKWRDFEETKAALLEQYNAAFPDSPDETDEDDDSYPVNNLLEEGVYDEEDSEKYSIHIPNLKYAEDFLQNELGIQVPSKIGSEKDTSQKKGKKYFRYNFYRKYCEKLI